MLAVFLSCALGAFAHPMGNFSVNHYTRVEVGADCARLRYVLDLAEIPTFELFQQWGLDASSSRAELERHAAMQARQWAAKLAVRLDGRVVRPVVGAVRLVLSDGAANLPVARIATDLRVPAAGGRIEYEDRNYPDRAGWKEIVIRAGPQVTVRHASHGAHDLSRELTAYPQDPMLAPPQDLRAALAWEAAPVPISRLAPPAPLPVAVPAARAGRAPGTVTRGDFLSRLLKRSDIGWRLTLIGLLAAFGLGAIHALSPGHGKTIVAAYLVGSRGTFRHAVFLGGMVTFTHTVSVFLLGFVTLFLSRRIMPERLFPVLGAISGLAIVWVGTTLLWQRIRHWRAHRRHHHHDHDHHHPVPDGGVTLAGLAALGVSGGLVPCPSALVLLLSAVSLGRVGLGLLLLVGFSAGLAVVLTGIGVAAVYARNLLPESRRLAESPVMRLIPAISAAFIVCVGLVMTGVALAR